MGIYLFSHLLGKAAAGALFASRIEDLSYARLVTTQPAAASPVLILSQYIRYILCVLY